MSQILKKIQSVFNREGESYLIETATSILRELRNGNLKARVSVHNLDAGGRFLNFINEMAEELENLVERNKFLERSKTAWLQEMAHDLRTPLASIELAQTTLKESDSKLSSEQKKELIEDSLREVHYVKNLVEDLLFLSLLEDPTYFSSKEMIVVGDFYKKMIELYKEKSYSLTKKIIWNTNVELEKLTMNVNQALLKRLFRNCLDNALTYCISTVAVDCSVNDDLKILSITISNDGPSMTEEQIRDFGIKRESKNSQRDSRLPTSLGLGSVIVFRGVKSLGGTFKIQNVSSSDKHLAGIKIQLDLPLL